MDGWAFQQRTMKKKKRHGDGDGNVFMCIRMNISRIPDWKDDEDDDWNGFI